MISALSSSVSKLLSVGFRIGVNNCVGGGRSTGFALIYDSVEDVKKFEAKYRLARVGLNISKNNDQFGLAENNRQSRKMLKEKKNHQKKIWGTGRRAALHKAKKAQDD